nr:caspase-3 [Corbicula fluminea]
MKGTATPEGMVEEIQADSASPKYTHTNDDSEILVPDGADMLIGYSTMPMFTSFRDKTTGSFYIRTLCDVLGENCDRYDLVTILTEVNRRVAIKNLGLDAQGDIRKQMPCFTSSLRKLLYLRKQNSIETTTQT